MPSRNGIFACVCALLILGAGSACQERAAADSPPDASSRQQALQLAASAAWRAANRGIESANVSTFAVDAFWPQLAYAVTGDGLLRTSTAGAYWRRVDAVPNDSHVQVLVDPNRIGVAFAGGNHLYQTSDAGRSWAPNSALDELRLTPGTTRGAQPLAIARGDSNVMWAAVNGALEIQLAKTTDGGKSWTVGNAPGSRGSCCLAMLALSASHVYLSTLTGAPSLFESQDGGASWTRLTGLNLSFIETLAADPEDADVLYAAGLLIENGEQYTNVLRKSTDAGATWFAPTEQFAGGHVDRVAVSKADGRVYVAVRTRPDARVSSVFVSTDAGATFTAATSGLETHALTALAPMPSLPCGVYAATSDAGVFKTWSGGGSCR